MQCDNVTNNIYEDGKCVAAAGEGYFLYTDPITSAYINQ